MKDKTKKFWITVAIVLGIISIVVEVMIENYHSIALIVPILYLIRARKNL